VAVGLPGNVTPPFEVIRMGTKTNEKAGRIGSFLYEKK
jgi:hypothetical protein